MPRKFVFFLLLLFFVSCDNNQAKPFSVWREPITNIEFVLIPKGSFLMGERENHLSESSESLHKVTISKDFWLANMEVTQRLWQEIMGNMELHPEKPSPFRNSNPQYPIVSVSYFDIQEFLTKLNVLSKTHHFRLPSEAEWEYACRAGTKTPFSYGIRLSDSLANFNAEIPSLYSQKGMNIGHPMSVGSYPPNPWGLYDMHGNVWEWVNDWYAPYSMEQVVNPRGPSYGTYKIIRGGSWYFGARNAKSSFRKTHKPDLWGFSIGFRIVCKKKT